MDVALEHIYSCIAYGVGFMNRVGGLQAWRWLFILEGVPSGERNQLCAPRVSHSELISSQFCWGYSCSCSSLAIRSNALGLLKMRRLFKEKDSVK
jgi:hypothetical protein